MKEIEKRASEFADHVNVSHRVNADLFIGKNEYTSVKDIVRAAYVAGATDFSLPALCDRVHVANAKWWVNLDTGEPLKRNVGELLALVHSEISEALEGDRKNLMDDKLPHRKMFEVELADAIIRIFDIAGGFSLDLGGAFEEKMAYNAVRADHQHEARLKSDGKKY